MYNFNMGQTTQENSNAKRCLVAKSITTPEHALNLSTQSHLQSKLILASNQINKITNKTSPLNSDELHHTRATALLF